MFHYYLGKCWGFPRGTNLRRWGLKCCEIAFVSGILNTLRTDVGRPGSEKGRVGSCVSEQIPGSNKPLLSLKKKGSAASRKGIKILFPRPFPLVLLTASPWSVGVSHHADASYACSGYELPSLILHQSLCRFLRSIHSPLLSTPTSCAAPGTALAESMPFVKEKVLLSSHASDTEEATDGKRVCGHMLGRQGRH